MTEPFQPFLSAPARQRFLAHLESLERLWPVPRESTTVPTRFGDTFVRLSGPAGARPVVLLPGGQSNSLVWRRLVKPLSECFRVHAVDAIYDEGRSVPTRPVTDVDALCAWLDEVLDGLRLPDGVALAGQSYGAYAAAEYALHAPRRIDRLAWIAPVMIGAPLSAAFIARMATTADGSRESLEAYCRWIMPAVAGQDPGEFDRRIEEILRVRECYGPMIPPVRAAAFSDEDLRRITMPVLQVLGDADGATADPLATCERVRSLVPDVECLLVPGAGHDVVASHTDLLASRLPAFLSAGGTSG